MKVAQTQHIKDVISVATAADGAAWDGTDDLIHKSWLRCLNDHGLDPSRPRPARILPSHMLREHQEKIEEFLRVARGGMEQMYKRVSDLGYMLLLTDSAGITVDYIANPAGERELKAAGLYPGADWNEVHAGTCGVGTCLIERTPITCHQQEHFDATHIGLTCTTAPLFDPEGELLAVLDVSALHSPEPKESQHLALHLTIMYAQMIENANFLRHFRDRWILRMGKAWGLVEVAGEVMLAFDHDGIVVGANTGARQEIATAAPDSKFKSLLGRQITDLFHTSMDVIWRLARAGIGTDGSIISSQTSEQFYASVITPRRQAVPRLVNAMATVRTVAAADQDFPALDRLSGDDPAMQRLLEQSKRLINRKVNILVHGETGTGKEVLAKALHESSSRAKRPFVAVNCSAIPESLIESELFGYTPGSFTGGKSKGMKGLILQSDGGTLFLDEIGDMPLHLQTRFLRVLSEFEVLPLGAERPVRVDLNVIAASHRDLRQLIAAGTFREDLYYRLCGATLYLPAFRERADKRYLIEKVLAEEAEHLQAKAGISSEAMSMMLNYSWPGNIRQLRNVLRFALALSDDRPIGPDELPRELGLYVGQPSQTSSAVMAINQGHESACASVPVERETNAGKLVTSLRRNKWNITSVADELNICRATVYRQMKKFNIIPPNRL